MGGPLGVEWFKALDDSPERAEALHNLHVARVQFAERSEASRVENNGRRMEGF